MASDAQWWYASSEEDWSLIGYELWKHGPDGAVRGWLCFVLAGKKKLFLGSSQALLGSSWARPSLSLGSSKLFSGSSGIFWAFPGVV